MNYSNKIVLATLLALCHFAVPAMAANEDAKTKEAAPQAATAPVQPQQTEAVAKPATAAPVKIGYVDMSKIGSESNAGKAVLAQLKEKTEKYRSQIAAKQKQLEKNKAEIEAKLPTLSPKEREAKGKAFQKKVEEFQKFVQNAEKEMRGKEEELAGKLFRAVEQAAGEFGKANGFAAIVPKKELLYLGEMVEVKELTEEIMKKVDTKK